MDISSRRKPRSWRPGRPHRHDSHMHSCHSRKHDSRRHHSRTHDYHSHRHDFDWIVLHLLCSSFLLAGCGARTEFFASDLRVERSDWDSVFVDVSFARRTVIGGEAPIAADTIRVALFDESYDSLYSGGTGTIAVPDRELGDRERITVEVCGTVHARQICVQETLRSSAKRLQLDEQIEYPSDSDMAKGSYEFEFEVEREDFDGSGWEPIESADVNGYLIAWVDDAEAERKGKVRVPFSSARGQFNLSRHANYKNFRYFLDSQLLDAESAHVNFDVFGGLSRTPIHLASVRKEVHKISEEERADQVRYFVEQATENLIDELDSFLGGRGASAYVRDWNFNPTSRVYRIPLRIEWRGPFYNRGEFELEGVLEVGEDGSNATFEFRDGNRRARRRWEDRTDERSLRLGYLDPQVPQDPRAPI